MDTAVYVCLICDNITNRILFAIFDEYSGFQEFFQINFAYCFSW